MEYWDSIGPTHWKLSEAECAVWHLECSVVARCFRECVLIVPNIEVE